MFNGQERQTLEINAEAIFQFDYMGHRVDGQGLQALEEEAEVICSS